MNSVTNIDLITNEIQNDTTHTETQFTDFINQFNINDDFIYRRTTDTLLLNTDHINTHDPSLAQILFSDPLQTIKIFERALEKKNGKKVDVQLDTSINITPLKNIVASKLNCLIKIKGLVVSTAPVFVKPTKLFLVCRKCLSTRTTEDFVPRSCAADCGLDPFILVSEKSETVDAQYIKIQEEERTDVSRHATLLLENRLTKSVVPGMIVTATGILLKSKNGTHLKVVGLETKNEKVTINFSAEEESFFMDIKKETIFKSIAPSVYGNEDVKKMIACALFGGVQKNRFGTKTRGSINVLLLGDPGIAKSQLLKFASLASPIGVYTSGKGSSAAGLTCSVLRDKNGFYLEGGALILANGGVCCIDEFDKMNLEDQVAIHEAMEQQTISISKAGIVATLNSRAAVIAAANPVFGRYDEFKTPGENVNFGATILSRFDSIFVLKDVASVKRDEKMAEHVLGIHSGLSTEALSVDVLRRYIQFAKRIEPVLGRKVIDKLANYYVMTRKRVNAIEKISKERSSVPITVRQLEAIVRIAESLARMSLRSEVEEEDVDEAIRLFNVSTMNAVSQGHYCEGMLRSDFQLILKQIAEELKVFLPVNCAKSYSACVLHCSGYEEALVAKAVDFMVSQGKMVLRDNNRTVVRLP